MTSLLVSKSLSFAIRGSKVSPAYVHYCVVCTHKGTGNMWVSIINRLLRHYKDDELAGDNSIVQGESSANQRIDAYWSKLI